MGIHLTREIDYLKKQMVALSGMVEEAIARSITALERCDRSLAESVIAGDGAIDQAEVRMEEECLKILALHQPVATDLRFVITVMKMNNAIERMGDQAAGICKLVLEMSPEQRIGMPGELPDMANHARLMAKAAFDALMGWDVEAARQIIASDDELDQQHSQLQARLIQRMKSSSDSIDQLLLLYSVVRRLERLGDMAVSIAEDVIYLVEAEIVRHTERA